ncbi:hypothetical protein OS493_014370 [Desmophyllum pertusum]|uniref:rRNA-processing protein EFG1 n=1 Tax=Desmophyllum pertusum TaxID=174260 RepID=A0A9W9YPC9_9CNID|nr:hypothetical protein OS493_014370 [Desmophyllum pertusum]
MGPRKQGFNRSTKVSQKDGNKIKPSKSLKNKVRDVQRLLKKSDLPATVRVVQERMLDVLKETIKDKAKEDKEKKVSKIAKKVKFFEKRKIFRKYKTCAKELKETEDSNTRNTLQKELEEIKQQWNYVVHFPQDTKYISLFPLTSCTNAEVCEKQGTNKSLKHLREGKSGELEDAFTTIDQMSSGFKERKGAKPKVILRVEPDKLIRKEKVGMER